MGVLTHELLHALGLGHTNDISDSNNCDPNHPATASVNSTMWAGDTYSRLWRRRLKRDDISSAVNGRPANGAMLVGYTPTFPSITPAPDGYAKIFTMDRNGLGALDGGVDNPWTFQTWFWPLHVDTQNKSLTTDAKWRAITY